MAFCVAIDLVGDGTSVSFGRGVVREFFGDGAKERGVDGE